jgi:hypothetical protein
MCYGVDFRQAVKDTIKDLQSASADQAACPDGGTGAAGGAWDNATHRDAAIALINEMRDALIRAGLMKGSA